jgi:hypothetical protein
MILLEILQIPRAAFILKNPSGLYVVLDFLSGFEEFMKE